MRARSAIVKPCSRAVALISITRFGIVCPRRRSLSELAVGTVGKPSGCTLENANSFNTHLRVLAHRTPTSD